jgi:hypothetical protein
MKEILKTAYHASLLFIQTVTSILSVLFFSKIFFRKKLKELVKKKSNYCFLIVNGPSLKEVFKEGTGIFEGQDVFTVNLFYETHFFEEMKPKNHIIADNAFWMPAEDERIEGIIRRFEQHLLAVTWDMNLHVPYAGFKMISKKLEANKNVKVIPYNHTPVIGYKKISYFLYRNNFGMPRPANVLNAAIFLALNAGYKKLYLYGADHSWLKDLFVDEENNICSYQNHFYDDKKLPYKMVKGTLKIGIQGIIDAFESYEILNDYSKSMEARIINKTKGSYIDIFDFE